MSADDDLIEHVRAVNARAQRERSGWRWDPPRSRAEVRRRYTWDLDVPLLPRVPVSRGRVHENGSGGPPLSIAARGAVGSRTWNDGKRRLVADVYASAFTDWLVDRLEPADAVAWRDRMTLPVEAIAARDGCSRKTVQRREARVTALAREQWPAWTYSRDLPFPFARRPYRRLSE